MNVIKKISGVALVAATVLSGCGSDNTNYSTINFTHENLTALGDDYDYEGWLIVNGSPISTGKFDIASGQSSLEFRVRESDANEATAFVLTIEPESNDTPDPADTHILAGDISSGSAQLTTSHAAAMGDDFSSASGSFILATPSNGNATPTQGIWYPSLTLPTLPAGWAYEGWIVGASGPISTGTFTDAGAADSDGAGATGGTQATPAFPGQDYVNPAMDLIGTKAVISVEPSPDNSAAPFLIKPLAADITSAAGGTLGNIVGTNIPKGTVTIN